MVSERFVNAICEAEGIESPKATRAKDIRKLSLQQMRDRISTCEGEFVVAGDWSMLDASTFEEMEKRRRELLLHILDNME